MTTVSRGFSPSGFFCYEKSSPLAGILIQKGPYPMQLVLVMAVRKAVSAATILWRCSVTLVPVPSVSLRRAVAWKNEVNAKGINKEKKPRPEGRKVSRIWESRDKG